MRSNTNKKILIVEDAPDVRNLMEMFLDSEGFSVSCASNGQEALDVLKNSSEAPAVILLDLMMPVMDGYVFRAEQEKDPRLACIPVVVMTADGHVQPKATQLGAQGFLKKPLDIDDLLETVMRFC